MKNTVVDLINKGLAAITGKKKVPMHYETYHNHVVLKHKVHLVGWPLCTATRWKNPSWLRVPELHTVLRCLTASPPTLFWVPLSTEEIDSTIAARDEYTQRDEVPPQYISTVVKASASSAPPSSPAPSPSSALFLPPVSTDTSQSDLIPTSTAGSSPSATAIITNPAAVPTTVTVGNGVLSSVVSAPLEHLRSESPSPFEAPSDVDNPDLQDPSLSFPPELDPISSTSTASTPVIIVSASPGPTTAAPPTAPKQTKQEKQAAARAAKAAKKAAGDKVTIANKAKRASKAKEITDAPLPAVEEEPQPVASGSGATPTVLSKRSKPSSRLVQGKENDIAVLALIQADAEAPARKKRRRKDADE